MFIRIRGVLHYLWRAVDQHWVVLAILVQDRRNGTPAKPFFKRPLHGLQYQPRRLPITTPSYVGSWPTTCLVKGIPDLAAGDLRPPINMTPWSVAECLHTFQH